MEFNAWAFLLLRTESLGVEECAGGGFCVLYVELKVELFVSMCSHAISEIKPNLSINPENHRVIPTDDF